MTQGLDLEGIGGPLTTMESICHTRRHLHNPMTRIVLTARGLIVRMQPLVSIQAVGCQGIPGAAMLLI